MLDKKIDSPTNRMVYEDLATKSHLPNSDSIPLSRSDLQAESQKSHQKINKEFHQQYVDKKQYQDTLVSFDAHSAPQIDTSQLSAASKSSTFFEDLHKQQMPNFNKPVLQKPDALVAGSTRSLFKAPAVSASSKESSLLDNLHHLFDDWVVKPFKKLFGSDEPTTQVDIARLPAYDTEKFAEYIEKLEKELNDIQERAKENFEQMQDIKSRSHFFRLQWIRLVKAQIQFQEQQMAAMTEMISQKQLLIQERQKEHSQLHRTTAEKEEQMKPLAWIEKNAAITQIVTATVAGAITFASIAASFATLGASLAVLPTIPTAVGGFAATVGGVAAAVKGGAQWHKANLTYDLEQSIAQLKAWQHADDCDTEEIEKETKELSLKLESIQKLWEDLIHSAQMQHEVIMKSLR